MASKWATPKPISPNCLGSPQRPSAAGGAYAAAAGRSASETYRPPAGFGSRCSPMSKPAASSNSSTTTPPKPWALTMRCGPAEAIRDLIPKPASPGRATVPAYLQRWGCTSKKPRPMPVSDPDELESWKRPIPRSRSALWQKREIPSACDERVWRRHLLAVASRTGIPRPMVVRPPHPGEPDYGDQQRGDVGSDLQRDAGPTLFLVFLGRLLAEHEGSCSDRRPVTHRCVCGVHGLVRQASGRIALFYLPRCAPEGPCGVPEQRSQGQREQPACRTTSRPCGSRMQAS